MKRRSLWLISVLVFVMACLGMSQAAADPAVADPAVADPSPVDISAAIAPVGISAAEADFLGRINQLRSTVGAAALEIDPALTDVARRWAGVMASSGNLVHNPDLRYQAPAGYSLVGENIGWGSDVNIIDLYLRNSPLHFQNMVNPAFNKIGIGVVEANGHLYVVEDFTASR